MRDHRRGVAQPGRALPSGGRCRTFKSCHPDQRPAGAPVSGRTGAGSIDALELSLAISRRYGVQLRSDDQDNLRIFANLRSLSQYVAQQIADKR